MPRNEKGDTGEREGLGLELGLGLGKGKEDGEKEGGGKGGIIPLHRLRSGGGRPLSEEA